MAKRKRKNSGKQAADDGGGFFTIRVINPPSRKGDNVVHVPARHARANNPEFPESRTPQILAMAARLAQGG